VVKHKKKQLQVRIDLLCRVRAKCRIIKREKVRDRCGCNTIVIQRNRRETKRERWKNASSNAANTSFHLRALEVAASAAASAAASQWSAPGRGHIPVAEIGQR
jgi:hypothetical protein